jgi:hypothetical protein
MMSSAPKKKWKADKQEDDNQVIALTNLLEKLSAATTNKPKGKT